MATLGTTLSITDRMTRPLRSIRSAMDTLVVGTNRLRDSLAQASPADTYGKARPLIDGAGRSQRGFNDQLNEGDRASKRLLGNIKGLAAAYISIRGLAAAAGQVRELSDNLVTINSRLAMINDGSQSLAQFNADIFKTAQDARTSYMGMAETISKLGLNAGDAFKSNDELITFADQLNKQYVIAGTNAQGIAAANLQLTQAMASGVLRGEELNSIFENAPTIIAAISKEMGVSKGAIRELAKEGEITADIVKRSLLNSAEETNAAFERMPKTWGQTRQMFINESVMAFRPLATLFSNAINSPEFTAGINWTVARMHDLARVTVFTANVMGAGFHLAGAAINKVRNIATRYQDVLLWIGVTGGALLIATHAPMFLAFVRGWGRVIMLTLKFKAISIAAALASAAAWALAHWPITLVAVAFGVAAVAARRAGLSIQVMVAQGVGSIYYLGSQLQNVPIWFDNVAIRMSNAGANAGKRIQYSFEMAGYGIRVAIAGALDFITNKFNGWINTKIAGINLLISGLNKVGKVNIPQLSYSRVSVGSGFVGERPQEPEWADPKPLKEYRGYSDHWAQRNKGYNQALNMMSGITDRFGNLLGRFDTKVDDYGAYEGIPGLGGNDTLISGLGDANKELKDINKNTKGVMDYLKDDIDILSAAARQRSFHKMAQIEVNAPITINASSEADYDGFVSTFAVNLKEELNNVMGGNI